MVLDERWIILIYFILKPLYFFDSGLPQVSDMFLIFAFFYIMIRDRGIITMPKQIARWILIFAAVIIYQVFIDIVWTGITGDKKMLVYAAQYVFNFFAALLCIVIGQKTGMKVLLKTIAKGCFYCSIVIGIGLILTGGSGVRRTGFFNNPNQLGYFSLIILSCVLLYEKEFTAVEKSTTVALTIIGCIVSLSKSAILGAGGLLIAYSLFGNNEKSVKRIVFQIVLIISICGLIYWLFFSNSTTVMNNRILYALRNRILNLNKEYDSSLGEGRGYSRVFETGLHFLWGMGEGAYTRFSSLSGKEVHSTYVNMLVSYGVFATLAYAWIFINPMIDGKNTMRNIACFSGVYLYFIAHNGIRNTLMWFILATVLQISVQFEHNVHSEVYME